MSFIEITESQVVAPDTASRHRASEKPIQEVQNRTNDDQTPPEASLHTSRVKNEKLFAVLSSHSDIDHPICAECTSLLLQSFTARLASATKERDAYASFLKQLQQNAASTTKEDEEKVEKELADLLKQDEESYEELLRLEKEKATLEAELADLEEESRQLEVEEEAFWASRNAFDEELHQTNSELASLQQKYAHDTEQLEKLQRTNVYNDTFCIGHDGYFGTINGLRLGKLPGQNVEWAEINAAWGQTVFLLATVSERLGFEFERYRLRPLGSRSRIEKVEWPQQAPSSAQPKSTGANRISNNTPQPKITQLPLYSTGETPITRVMSASNYDRALVAFLDCLAQVGNHVQSTTTAVGDGRPALVRSPSTKGNASGRVLPYTIQGDKIEGVSIRLGMGFQQDENFTKACKYALTCCKFLLAYVSNLESPKTS